MKYNDSFSCYCLQTSFLVDIKINCILINIFTYEENIYWSQHRYSEKKLVTRIWLPLDILILKKELIFFCDMSTLVCLVFLFFLFLILNVIIEFDIFFWSFLLDLVVWTFSKNFRSFASFSEPLLPCSFSKNKERLKKELAHN